MNTLSVRFKANVSVPDVQIINSLFYLSSPQKQRKRRDKSKKAIKNEEIKNLQIVKMFNPKRGNLNSR